MAHVMRRRVGGEAGTVTFAEQPAPAGRGANVVVAARLAALERRTLALIERRMRVHELIRAIDAEQAVAREEAELDKLEAELAGKSKAGAAGFGEARRSLEFQAPIASSAAGTPRASKKGSIDANDPQQIAAAATVWQEMQRRKGIDVPVYQAVRHVMRFAR